MHTDLSNHEHLVMFEDALGEETPMVVRFFYQPFEPMEYEGGVPVYPGCPETVEVEEATLYYNGVPADVTLLKEYRESLEEEILELIAELREDHRY